MAVFLGDDDQPPLNPALFPWRWALAVMVRAH